MQDKKLNDMTAKYKEEMMRLYSRKQPADRAPQTAAEPPHNADEANETAPPVGEASRSAELSRPPMPQIPENYGGAAKKTLLQTKTAQEASPRFPPRFPPAEEILRAEEEADKNEASYHEQGNYPASAEAEISRSYPNENTNFEAPDPNGGFPAGNAANMTGQGFLQVEVTAADRAVPVQGATVIVAESINGRDTLISMSVTDESGSSPTVPLPAPSGKFSEAPDPSERPYSEYIISVYRKGFYSVPELTVPVFDTIKSIQPVSLIPLAGDREGSVFPSGKEADNG